METGDYTAMAIIATTTAGLVKLLDKAMEILKKRNGKSSNGDFTSEDRRKLDSLEASHRAVDSDGVPLHQVPRRWGVLLERISESIATAASTQAKTVEILDRIERRKCPLGEERK